MTVLSFIIGVIVIVGAIIAIETKNLLTSVVMLSLVSLLSVVLFIFMKRLMLPSLKFPLVQALRQPYSSSR